MAAADFAPYQVILDREIFGRPPPAPVAPPAAASAPDRAVELLAKKITMCAVNRTPSGNTAIGFIDNDAKPPRNIYLNVGESSDGYRIVAADYDEETATIEKDGVTVTLKLGKGLVTAPVAAAPPPGSPLPVVGMPARVRGAVGGRVPVPGLTKLQQPGVRSVSPTAQSGDTKTTNEPSYREQLQHRTVQEQERERLAREAEEKVARERFEELAREITAEEVRKQVLAAEQAWEGAEDAAEDDEGDDAWAE